MRVTVLASGSAGNSILVEAEGTKVLVDAGLSVRELAKRLDRVPTATRLDDIQAVCMTHEHTDHASGVASLASAGVPVYATAGTARVTGIKVPDERTITAGTSVRLGGLELIPVALPHDAAEPVGFVATDEHGRAGFLTDCGWPDPQVARAFGGCDLLVLETNHDGDLLKAGSYPASLKRRIAGRRGHLSNEQAADMLRLMRTEKPAPPQVLMLAHLSRLNNRPRLARSAIERALPSFGSRPRLIVAPQDRPAPPVRLERGRITILQLEDNRQLRLAFPDWI